MSRVDVKFDERGEVVAYSLRPKRDLRALAKAVRLSPTIEVCEALLRGERIPLDRLDREQVLRLGRRP